jgi:hypothetical protein
MQRKIPRQDGFVLKRRALCVVTEWTEHGGFGWVAVKGMPQNKASAYVNRAELQKAGFDTLRFADVFVGTISFYNGVRVVVQIREATQQDMEKL